jgi:hypothetical protein
VGTHRRISHAPSSAGVAAVHAGERCTSATPLAGGYPRVVSLPAAVCGGIRLTAKDTPPIDRPVDPSPRAVKGATALSPSPALWPPRRRGRVGGSYSIAAPICLRAGRNGQRASRVLYIGEFHGVAEPRHARPPLTPLSHQLAPHIAEGATLGQGGIPMSQIALVVGAAPARRLRRAGGHLKPRACGSIRLIPIALFTCQSPRAARVPLPAYLRPIRAPSRGAPVGAWIRPQRTLPTTIRRAWDGLVARRVEAAPTTIDRRSLVSCGTHTQAAPPAKVAAGRFAGSGDRGLWGVGIENRLVGGCGRDVPRSEYVRQLRGRCAAPRERCGAIGDTNGNVYVFDDGHGVAEPAAGRRIGHSAAAVLAALPAGSVSCASSGLEPPAALSLPRGGNCAPRGHKALTPHETVLNDRTAA